MNWFRQSSRPAPWTQDELVSLMAQSDTGERLLEGARQSGCQISVLSPKDDPSLAKNPHGHFLAKLNKIVISSDRSLDSAIGTLAYLCEHARQSANGGFPNPAHFTKEQFVGCCCDLERTAESVANQVAFELSQRGFPGPGMERKSNRNSTFYQSRDYFDVRAGGGDHQAGVAKSEGFWEISEIADWHIKVSGWMHDDFHKQKVTNPQAPAPQATRGNPAPR